MEMKLVDWIMTKRGHNTEKSSSSKNIRYLGNRDTIASRNSKAGQEYVISLKSGLPVNDPVNPGVAGLPVNDPESIQELNKL